MVTITQQNNTEKVKIIDLEIDNISRQTLLENLKTGGVVFTPNVDHIIKLQSDREFYRAYQQADYVVCDSQILLYASSFLGTKLVEKISGSDLFPSFYNYYKSDNNVKIFLLGGNNETVKLAQSKINSKVGREIIVGAYSPPFGFEKDSHECDRIIDSINSSGATVLAVGVGAPKQEKWIIQYKSYLPKVKTFLAIGATINFEADIVNRSPRWMSQVGLEWLYRLISEPKRLWRRYLVDSWLFFWLLFQQKINSDFYEESQICGCRYRVRRNLKQQTQLYQFQCTIKEYNRLAEFENWSTEDRINFLVEELPKLAKNKNPLGQYLKAAKLLTDNQIEQILAEQKTSELRFGEIAIAKGWLKPMTIEFFLETFSDR